jgi:hypothetical protein
MKIPSLKHVVAAILLGLSALVAPGCQTASSQTRFATPDEAAGTLQKALKSGDTQQLQAIFGREGMEAVASGDPVADRNDREVISLAMDESWHWDALGADRKELIIGYEEWPFPVPLVKSGSAWMFDSEAGKTEVLARRIGRNELGVISLCRDYVGMQKQYASRGHDGKPAGLFAQRLRSSPGHEDGLYWERKPGEKPSPLGDLVADATAEGYNPARPEGSAFRGYCYRIRTSQGPAAPGGQKSYIANGQMTGGFALVAFPAKYASSGVMTFIVGQDGVVYQKDLGKATTVDAPRLEQYNPDDSWQAVQTP